MRASIVSWSFCLGVCVCMYVCVCVWCVWMKCVPVQNVFLTVIPAKNLKTVGQEKLRPEFIDDDYSSGMRKEYFMRELTGAGAWRVRNMFTQKEERTWVKVWNGGMRGIWGHAKRSVWLNCYCYEKTWWMYLVKFWRPDYKGLWIPTQRHGTLPTSLFGAMGRDHKEIQL